MKKKPVYDGILVCGPRGRHDPFAAASGIPSIDAQCGACGRDIKHRPNTSPLKLLPLCELCGMAMAVMDEEGVEVTAMPGAVEEFEEVYGNGTAQACIDVSQKQIDQMRAAIPAELRKKLNDLRGEVKG